MEYIATFSVAYTANDDENANRIAQRHHEQIRTTLQIEGSVTPAVLTLEHVVAIEAAGSRMLPQSNFDSKPI